jgi:hypothetical protein
MVNPHELEVAMTRTALRDALSALASVTHVSGAACGAAVAQSKAIKVHRAEVAVDAVRGPKPMTPMSRGVARDVMSLAGPATRRTATGHDWRWWQDYGAGRYAQASVQTELSQ